MGFYYYSKSEYISSGSHTAVAGWAAGHAYSVGDVIRPTYTSGSVTMTLANPAVFTWLDNAGAALVENFSATNPQDTLVFNNNSDTLPTSLSFGTNAPGLAIYKKVA